MLSRIKIEEMNTPCLGSGNGGYFVVSDVRNGEVQELVFKVKPCGVFGLEELD